MSVAALPGGGGADVLIGFSQVCSARHGICPRPDAREPDGRVWQGDNFSACLAARASAAVRAIVLLAPSRPGWAKQLPTLFAAPLAVPALIAWSDTDKVCLDGPEHVANLFEPGCVVRHKHGGPGHRPLPSAKEERDATVQAMRELIERCCPP